MRLKNCLGSLVVLAGVSLILAPAFAQQQQSQSGTAEQQTGDPVADAARKAREQQKTAPKPKKVYTDDDIKPATPAQESGGQGQAAAGAGGTGTAEGAQGAAGAAGQESPEATWRKRFADQRTKIEKAEKELDILQREEEKAQLQYYPDPQKALQEQYSRKDINDKQAKIDAKKKEIADLKQQLSDMEDELRKSGGDPGWARQ